VANVTVDALGATTRMTGKVTGVDPVATIQQGVPVYGVDVTIDVPNAAMRPGMSGTANVILVSRQDVLTVPNLAVKTQGSRRYLQVLKDGQPVDVDATFGISNDTLTEVTGGGLKEGDLVVLPQARAGATVAPNRGGPQLGPGPGQQIVINK
jgi:multidrug efflux pump subunit AcrA (membrane-fusion protein)